MSGCQGTSFGRIDRGGVTASAHTFVFLQFRAKGKGGMKMGVMMKLCLLSQSVETISLTLISDSSFQAQVGFLPGHSALSVASVCGLIDEAHSPCIHLKVSTLAS